jgi:hypothetical protein
MESDVLIRRARFWIVLFVIGLVLSGVTAFPLGIESRWLDRFLHGTAWPIASHLRWGVSWIDQVSAGLTATYAEYPFVAYGTDWLAFAHLMIAVAFYGPYRDPVRNIWVVQFGLIACLGVIPLALICGPLRHIPTWWTPVDISFGVFGAIPLYIIYRLVKRIEATDAARQSVSSAPA